MPSGLVCIYLDGIYYSFFIIYIITIFEIRLDKNSDGIEVSLFIKIYKVFE